MIHLLKPPWKKDLHDRRRHERYGVFIHSKSWNGSLGTSPAARSGLGGSSFIVGWFLNVLCPCKRQGLLQPQEAAEILTDALSLMDGKSYDIPPGQVLLVARRTGCSAYDSQVIALAGKLGVKLSTNDGKILTACPGLAVLPPK